QLTPGDGHSQLLCLQRLRLLSGWHSGHPRLGMSILGQMARSGNTDSRRRSVTVGPISNSATPSRLMATPRRASPRYILLLSVGRVALFPFSPSVPFLPQGCRLFSLFLCLLNPLPQKRFLTHWA